MASEKSPMEQAKEAVEAFMFHAGHHDTTVHEKVAPAVTHETITRTEHEELLTAIDKEIHQDHYHTSVQPINDEFLLGEEHRYNLVTVEHRSFDHDDEHEVRRRLTEEAAKFRDELVHVEGKHTNAVLPVMTAEHIHHHVHETIQPIINKQVIEPHIIHTTVPIHEVHHNAAQHHATSALPAVSMADFKRQGGVLTGREERYDGFEGEPRSVGKALVGNNSRPTSSQTGATGNSTDQYGSNNAAPTAAAKTAATGAAPARTGSAKPSQFDSGNSTNNTDGGDGRRGITPFEAQRVNTQSAGPFSSSATAPQPPRTAPIAPPLPSTNPAHGLSPITHRQPTGITAAPTYLSIPAYHSRHPAGQTGARPAPTLTPHPQPQPTRRDEDDDS